MIGEIGGQFKRLAWSRPVSGALVRLVQYPALLHPAQSGALRRERTLRGCEGVEELPDVVQTVRLADSPGARITMDSSAQALTLSMGST